MNGSTPIFSSGDIFAPQDGAGDYQPIVSGSSVQGPPTTAQVTSIINGWYPPLLQAAAGISGMQVWANADTYQADSAPYGSPYLYTEYDPAYSTYPWVEVASIPAGINRLAAQFQAESTVNYGGTNYLTGFMNCANTYYYDSLGQWANPAWNTAWAGWQSSQTTSTSGPSAPSVSGLSHTGGNLEFNLSVSSSPNGPVGYSVWRDSYVAGSTPYVTVEIPVTSGPSTTFIDPDTSSSTATHTYTISAYDVYGNVSSTTVFTSYSGSVAGLSVSPSTIYGGNSATGTVTLSSAAGAGGALVSLSSNNSCLTVPATVTVPAGATSATFAVGTTGVYSYATSTITASTGGSSLQDYVGVIEAGVSSLTLSPTSVVGGASSTGTVTLIGYAGVYGENVNLSSSNGYATVYSTVWVAAGANTATFTVWTSAVSSTKTSVITATADYAAASATLSITKR